MKLISLNTWSGVIWEPMAEFFKSYADVDVFCLQEIYKDANEKEILKNPTRDMKYDTFERIESILADTHTGYFRAAHEDFYGQAIFVKKGIQVDDEGDLLIFQPEGREGHSGRNRNLHYITLSIEGKPTLIANVHGLWNGMGKNDTEDRIEQSRRIQTFLTSRMERIVLIGDFNLNPDTESLALLEEGKRNLIKEYGITSTRTSFYEREGTFADYALVSPDIEVIDFKVLPEEVSDHAALYLEFT